MQHFRRIIEIIESNINRTTYLTVNLELWNPTIKSGSATAAATAAAAGAAGARLAARARVAAAGAAACGDVAAARLPLCAAARLGILYTMHERKINESNM